jgi:hypothetical protein
VLLIITTWLLPSPFQEECEVSSFQLACFVFRSLVCPKDLRFHLQALLKEGSFTSPSTSLSQRTISIYYTTSDDFAYRFFFFLLLKHAMLHVARAWFLRMLYFYYFWCENKFLFFYVCWDLAARHFPPLIFPNKGASFRRGSQPFCAGDERGCSFMNSNVCVCASRSCLCCVECRLGKWTGQENHRHSLC